MMCFSLAFMLLESVICPPSYYPPENIIGLPAVVMVYDPGLGGTNCDEDCSTIATSELLPEMYGTVTACHEDLLGWWVDIPTIGRYHCLDTGSAVTMAWSEYFNRWVLYFDILYDLRNQDAPSWAGTLIENYHKVTVYS